MSTKRATIILTLIALSILLVLTFTFFKSKGTTVTISNQTNEVVENLVFSSNDNEEEYSISKIDPNTSISFKYKIGGFNENAINLKHTSDYANKRTYNIIGYVDWAYSYINIDIISINKDGELNIRVEAPR